MRLALRLMAARWTQADGKQKAPFTGLFAVSGKWNSSFFQFSFFLFFLFNYCLSVPISKQGKNREQRKTNIQLTKGKNAPLRSTDPKENFQSLEVKRRSNCCGWSDSPSGSLTGLWAGKQHHCYQPAHLWVTGPNALNTSPDPENY